MNKCKLQLRLTPLAGLLWLSFAPVLSAQELSLELVRDYLWPENSATFEKASGSLQEFSSRSLSRSELDRVEEVLRKGPESFASLPEPAGTGEAIEIEATSPNGGIPVLVGLPPDYSPKRAWPLMVAMHGGPPGSREQALRGARRMLSVWTEAAAEQGWIVVAPAMVGVVSVAGRTEERLPYEIFHPEDFRSVVREVKRYLNIDPDRVVSTGISLGSNFSIAFGAAHPDWLSAIVPVSTEGESRQRLLRNLFALPAYVLEGAQDSNIRTISGPRSMSAILASQAYDFVYLEMSDRTHEGFAEHYPDVLRWLASRPRRLYPHTILRSPHTGIVPVARRLYWIESGDAEGLIRARVSSPNEIDIQAHNTRSVSLYLHDRLVNLDEPVRVRINGVMVYDQRVSRSLPRLLQEVRESGDRGRIFPAKLDLEVPRQEAFQAQGKRLWESFVPNIPEGQLSFWEMYAVRALEERMPALGLETERQPLPSTLDPVPGQQGLLIKKLEASGILVDSGLRAGDLIVRFGNHRFFEDHLQDLAFHVRRELRSHPRKFTVQVLREGKLLELGLSLSLGPYGGEG